MYAGNAVSVLFEFLQRLSEYSIGEVLEVVVEPEKKHYNTSKDRFDYSYLVVSEFRDCSTIASTKAWS